MSKTHMQHFEKEDIIHVAIDEGVEAASVEVNPNITAELNDKGELIGIEILNASSYLRDAVLESVQAKLLHLAEAHPK
jgi:uncharacterized protein YuzE